jgi:hypothetical protein
MLLFQVFLSVVIIVIIIIIIIDLKMEKVKNFQQNYLESEKFFSKFSYFLERENFQNLKVMTYSEKDLLE